jgi:hypothetical protein
LPSLLPHLAILALAFAAISQLGTDGVPRVHAYLACYLAAGLAWLHASRQVTHDPPRLRPSLALIVAGAVLLRLLAWAGPYVLSTRIRADMHRFMWNGWVTSQGVNPYRYSPLDVMRGTTPQALSLGAAAKGSPLARVLPRIGNPEIPTCYPPLAELFFAATARLAPGDPDAFRAALLLLDLGVCALVLLLLRAAGRPDAWLLLYAWCPMVIRDFAGGGHYDPLAMLPTAAGVLLLMRASPSLGRRAAAGALLGLGIAAKLYPLVVVVVLAPQLGLVGLVPALGVPVLLLTPFLGVGAEVLTGLGTFLGQAGFHSSLFWVVLTALGGPDTVWFEGELLGATRVLTGFRLARLLLGAVYGLALLALARRSDWPPPARAFAALLALYLVNATGYPWYLAWGLPFAALYPSWTVGTLAVSVAAWRPTTSTTWTSCIEAGTGRRHISRPSSWPCMNGARCRYPALGTTHTPPPPHRGRAPRGSEKKNSPGVYPGFQTPRLHCGAEGSGDEKPHRCETSLPEAGRSGCVGGERNPQCNFFASEGDRSPSC